jgi:murein DD-endopeptidase MepM/ murein hydrolase activator NlpD
MAEQLPQSSVFNPLITTAQSLGASLPKKAQKYSPSESFGNVRGVATGKLPTDLASLGVITTPYEGSTAYESKHPGIDIANKAGTPIPAFTPGKVTEVVKGQSWTPNTPSFGNYVIVQDANGNYHRYSHLQDEFVQVGQTVGAGQALGTMGGTGSTYGATMNQPGIHLDYRIYDAAKKYYNPFQYLGNTK